jgi:hypothetical protein
MNADQNIAKMPKIAESASQTFDMGKTGSTSKRSKVIDPAI